MTKVVKIIVDDDGEQTEDNEWHYVVNFDATNRSFCKMEAYGFGESGAVFEEKHGKVTCPDCIRKIKEIKKVRL